MPELPEVETMRRGILPLVGSSIRRVERVACRLKRIVVEPGITTFRKRCLGHRIVDIGRVGKRLTVQLDSDDVIVFEPRMTGLVLLADPPDKSHLRFRLELHNDQVRQLLFWDRRGLGSVRLLSPLQYQQRLGPERIGPDALSLTAEQLQSALAASRREIKVALLDQHSVAGIGNLYASEILHVAGVHPQRPCQRLSRDEWLRLFVALRQVLQEAIRYEGSTLSDGTYRNALNRPGGYQSRHRVYDRQGQPCWSCGKGRVERIVQAQRSTFFCPRCQPKRRRREGDLQRRRR